MRIKARQYAQALLEALKDKNEKGAKSAIDNFIKLLAQNNDLKLADEICVQTEKIFNEEKGISEAEVISAGKLGSGALKSVKDDIQDESGARKINLKNIVDKSILGGMIVKYGDKVLDSSLRMRLGELRKQLVK